MRIGTDSYRYFGCGRFLGKKKGALPYAFLLKTRVVFVRIFRALNLLTKGYFNEGDLRSNDRDAKTNRGYCRY